jgi:CTP synthase
MVLLNDFHTSVRKSLNEIDPKWESYEGLIVCGSHSPQDVEKQIKLIKTAREGDLPTLGICFGMQLMAIEYAKNVLGIKNATSEEFGKGTNVVFRLPGFRIGIIEVEGRLESHWHQYAVNQRYIGPEWETIVSEGVLELMRLKDHPYYMGVQFHPEYQSSKKNPHPILQEFIKECK